MLFYRNCKDFVLIEFGSLAESLHVCHMICNDLSRVSTWWHRGRMYQRWLFVVFRCFYNLPYNFSMICLYGLEIIAHEVCRVSMMMILMMMRATMIMLFYMRSIGILLISAGIPYYASKISYRMSVGVVIMSSV